ncbi:MAG: hypothetical protein ACI845_002855 [Gammaproteobacteria bacterium]|jgi:hypothetical protein
MAVYRITRFAAPDMDKASAHTENMREKLESIGAVFIDIVSYGNGKGVVLAKYPDQASMDAATELSKEAFAGMVEAGIVDGDSIHPHAGEVINSF